MDNIYYWSSADKETSKIAGNLLSYPGQSERTKSEERDWPNGSMENRFPSTCQVKRKMQSKSKLKRVSRNMPYDLHLENSTTMPLIRYRHPVAIERLKAEGNASTPDSDQENSDHMEPKQSEDEDAVEEPINRANRKRDTGDTEDIGAVTRELDVTAPSKKKTEDTDAKTTIGLYETAGEDCSYAVSWKQLGFAAAQLKNQSVETTNKADCTDGDEIESRKKNVQISCLPYKPTGLTIGSEEQESDNKIWNWYETIQDGLHHTEQGSLEKLRKAGTLTQNNIKIRVGRVLNTWRKRFYDVLARHVTLFHANIDLMYPILMKPCALNTVDVGYDVATLTKVYRKIQDLRPLRCSVNSSINAITLYALDTSVSKIKRDVGRKATRYALRKMESTEKRYDLAVMSIPAVRKDLDLGISENGNIDCVSKLIWVIQAHLIHTIWSRLWFFALKVGPKVGLVNVTCDDLKRGFIDLKQKIADGERGRVGSPSSGKWIITELDIYPFMSKYRRDGIPYSLVFSQNHMGNLHKTLKKGAKRMGLHYGYRETDTDKFSVVTCKLNKAAALAYYRRNRVLETNWYVIVPPDYAGKET